MKVKSFFLCLLFVAVSAIASAQSSNVGGVVLDKLGQPIVGATVSVKGSKIKTSTDGNGKFSLPANTIGQTISISYIGMTTQHVEAKENLTITLLETSSELDEAVVVAFGKQKRSAFTGSAAVIKSDILDKKQTTNALSAIKGEVAGVQMTDISGDPAATPTIRIRGFSSINAGNDPLIILDGAPYDGGINNIPPHDIASITIQKDAASNALYGARGANGVIMITTKSGSKGKDGTQFSFDAKWGANSNASVRYDYVDNPAEYYEMFYKAAYNYNLLSTGNSYEAHTAANSLISQSVANGGLGYIVYGVPDGEYLVGENGKLNPHAWLGNVITNGETQYTLLPDDWTDEAFRSALRQEYNFSANSNLGKAQIYASLGYLNNQGIVYNSDYERYTARVKADWQATRWLSLGGNTSFAHAKQDYISDASNGLFATLQNMAPIYPVYIRDANGNIMTDSNGRMYDYGDGTVIGVERETMKKTNPLQESSLNTYEINSNNFSLNGYADIMPLDGLKLTLNGTVTNSQSRKSYTYNPFYGYSSTTYVSGAIGKVQTQKYSLNFQQLINYTKGWRKHTMTLLAGHESYKYRYDYLYGEKQGMASYFGNQNLSGATTIIGTGDYDTDNPTTDYNNEGWFFRGQYEYANKYFASVSYRRDASSRFDPDNRWGNFYSVGGAWIISKEEWFKASWVDQLKIKISVGQQGNDNIGEYGYSDLYSVTNNNGGVGLVWAKKGNKDITWETNTNLNIGVEFSLWQGRFLGTLEYFYRHTTDMLSFIYAPYEMGYAGSYYNVGNMDNKGVEIELNTIPIRTNNFTWSININATHYKNKITKLSEKAKTSVIDGHGGYISSYSDQFTGEGLPLYTWYLKKYAGVNEDGYSTWYTADGEKTTRYGDAAYFLCGNPIPKLYGGFGTKLETYGFDFSISFNYSIGGQAYDYQYATLMTNPTSTYAGYNFHRDLYNAWTSSNTTSDIPRFVYGDENTGAQSSRFLTNASYLSLQNINIGYTLPSNIASRLHVSSIRVYGTADNVCYWSKRKGFDPRGVFNGETSTSTYSSMRSVSGGISIQF